RAGVNLVETEAQRFQLPGISGKLWARRRNRAGLANRGCSWPRRGNPRQRLPKEQSVAKETEPETKTPPPAASTPADAMRQPMAVDATKAHAAYANFCRV